MAFPCGAQTVEDRQVRGRHIGRVHVVSNAGAVRSREVIAEDLHGRFPLRRVHDQRDEVGQAAVDQRKVSGSGNVEVSQARCPETGRRRSVAEHPLPEEF